MNINDLVIIPITDGSKNGEAWYHIKRASDNMILVHWYVKGHHFPKDLIQIVANQVIPYMRGNYPKYLYQP